MPFSRLKILLVFTCQMLIWTSATAVTHKRPIITVQHFMGEPLWKNITISQTQRAMYASQPDDLKLSCEASVPIRWNLLGVINPPDAIEIQPPRRNLASNLYQIKMVMFFSDAKDDPKFAVSAKFLCEDATNPNISDEISIFVKGSHQLVKLEQDESTVRDSFLIPCPTTDPTISTVLFLKSNGRETALDNVQYYPTEGFHSATMFNDGTYICRKQTGSSSSVQIRAIRSSSPDSEFHFTPSSETLRVFTDDVLEFECSSKSRPVSIGVSHPNVTIFYKDNPTPLRKAIRVYLNQKNTNEGSVKGKVSCTLQGQQRTTIREWSFEFIDAPVLYFDNFEGEVHCLSEGKEKVIQTVKCHNSMQCQVMSRCFKNATSCNRVTQRQFFSRSESYCSILHSESMPCVSVPYSHLNGIVQCTVSGLTRQWEFFVTLNLLRYSNWKDARQQDLLRMEEVNETLYTNASSNFLCIGASYLFANDITFEMELKNGSRKLIQDDGNLANISILGEGEPLRINEFNIITRLNIKLPIDAVGIHCHAPWWNSTELMSTSRKFATKHLLLPQIISMKTTETFYTGGESQRLECRAKGEPQPTYFWLYKNKMNNFRNVSEEFPELKTSTGSNGEGYLEFPTMNQKYAGVFKCEARNYIGGETREVSVTVSSSPYRWLYIGVAILVIVLLALMIATILIFVRRLKEAKELVRSLTDSEVDEFLNGKPELLANAEPHSMEAIEFLPFNERYEIPVEDLEFDSSEENYLGSGEFSYVVKGKIISKSRPVAIKISKPSADVTLFKSMLSEVKIMLYIGQHENIIAIIGVCTRNIRIRNIHIVTEICDLGSLDTFLRKRRPEFVNLIDANQLINIKLLKTRPQQLSTLDLISFAGQIAKGMEYLTFKSIVHADLATRNVLLTNDRVCKVSDFGLSKKLYECNNYVKKSKSPLPWRWMAIESLTTLTFSHQSDVWSYGATLYEVFTLGDIPFPNEDWDAGFISRLSSGMRMGRPRFSPQEIYSKIMTCWENDPGLRPNFSSFRMFFEEMMDHHTNTDGPGKCVSTPTPHYQMESLYANC